MGRPKGSIKPIDENLVEALARIGCTQTEIATTLGFSQKMFSLRKSLRAAHERGIDSMKTSLRRWQYSKAKEGNVAMLIWLGKQYLGQRDKIDETRREEVVTIEPFEIPKPRLVDSA